MYGAESALEEIAKLICQKFRKTREKRVQFTHCKSIRSDTSWFWTTEKCRSSKRNLQKYGWEVTSSWAMGDDLETLQRSGKAEVNLVVSAVGLRAAKVLWETYKIPYVIGTPNEWLAEDISKALEGAVTQQTTSKAVYLENRMQADVQITLIGEPVTMGSLAAGIEKHYGHSTRVLCPLKECESLIGEKDKVVLGEEAMEEELKGAKIIVEIHCTNNLSKGQYIL